MSRLRQGDKAVGDGIELRGPRLLAGAVFAVPGTVAAVPLCVAIAGTGARAARPRFRTVSFGGQVRKIIVPRKFVRGASFAGSAAGPAVRQACGGLRDHGGLDESDVGAACVMRERWAALRRCSIHADTLRRRES